MKTENINERIVKEVLRPNAADLSPKNNSPYMRKKGSGKKGESDFSAELAKKQLTPKEERQLRIETNKRIEKMMDDSLTLSGYNAEKTEKTEKNNLSDTEKATLASTVLDYSNKRRYDSYSKNNVSSSKNEEPSSFSVFNIILILCGLFLIVTGFIYIPVGIIWMVVGFLMLLYTVMKTVKP